MDSLMKRWNMSFSDIVLIVLNQDLTPAYSKYPDGAWKKYGEDPEHDILEVFLQRDVDPSRIVFLRSDIMRLEEKYGGQVSKSPDVLNEMDIIERWGISEIEFWNLQEECAFPVIDPLGIEFEDYSNLESHLLSYPKHNNLSFYFRLSDIERLEREYELKSLRKDDVKSDTSDIEKHSDVPIISFYKNGQMWLIGEKDKEIIFKDYTGFEFIRFLLRYPEERHDSVKVFYIGNVPDKLKPHLYENDFHKHSDPETIKKMSQYKSVLEEELKETIDPEHQKELEKQIEQCETFLKEANKSFSGGINKYRTKVLNGIKRAIKAIEKERIYNQEKGSTYNSS
jgi:hypothetical protein